MTAGANAVRTGGGSGDPARPAATPEDRLLARLTGMAADCIAETGHCYPSELFARSRGDLGAAEAIHRHYPTIVANAAQRLYAPVAP